MLVQSGTDLRIGQIGYGLGPSAFWGPAQFQYFQYWILRLVVFTRFRANRDCLLKLYVNQISKNSFLSFTGKYVSTLGSLHMVS